MRDNGMQGDFENGWKRTIADAAGNTVTNNYNFQDMRDATAQTIFDALSNVTMTGSLSVGNTQGTQTAIGAENRTSININASYVPSLLNILPSSVSSDKSAARLGDSIQINNYTDSTFVGVWTSVLAALYAADLGSAMFGGAIVSAVTAAYGGPPIATNMEFNGVISSGSDTVKIGDSSTE